MSPYQYINISTDRPDSWQNVPFMFVFDLFKNHYASSGRFGMFMFQVLQKAGIRGCKVF